MPGFTYEAVLRGVFDQVRIALIAAFFPHAFGRLQLSPGRVCLLAQALFAPLALCFVVSSSTLLETRDFEYMQYKLDHDCWRVCSMMWSFWACGLATGYMLVPVLCKRLLRLACPRHGTHTFLRESIDQSKARGEHAKMRIPGEAFKSSDVDGEADLRS